MAKRKISREGWRHGLAVTRAKEEKAAENRRPEERMVAGEYEQMTEESRQATVKLSRPRSH
jgi:hypothetical protein